jgi:hypothetical protein
MEGDRVGGADMTQHRHSSEDLFGRQVRTHDPMAEEDAVVCSQDAVRQRLQHAPERATGRGYTDLAAVDGPEQGTAIHPWHTSENSQFGGIGNAEGSQFPCHVSTHRSVAVLRGQ